MTRPLRPDTGDGQSLECFTCGTRTPSASWCCLMVHCDNCMPAHVCDPDPAQQLRDRVAELEAQRDQVLALCDKVDERYVNRHLRIEDIRAIYGISPSGEVS